MLRALFVRLARPRPNVAFSCLEILSTLGNVAVRIPLIFDDPTIASAVYLTFFCVSFTKLRQAGLAQLIQLGQTLEAWSEEIVAMWRFTRNNRMRRFVSIPSGS